MDKYRIRFEDFRLGRAWFTADKCENYGHAKQIARSYEKELENNAKETGRNINQYPLVLVVVQHDDESFSYID